MKTRKCKQCSMLIWVLVAALLSQYLVDHVTAITFEDQNNFSSPDSHARSPPTGSHRNPSHGITPSHGSGTPSHENYPTPSTPNFGIPPQVITPQCGGCGNTPRVPTPTPTTPSNPPSGGGGTYNPSPPYGGGTPPTPVIVNPPPSDGSGTPSHGSYPTPSTPNCGTPPQVTTPPCRGCGNTPRVPTPTPRTPTNPPSGGGGTYNPSPPYVGGTPPTPVLVNPPPTPTSVPTPPFVPDPNSPFSCYYWRTHPGIIWGLFGLWGTLGSAFGVTSLPGLGVSTSLQEALSNTRTDGYGTLYREGTASLLNSMVNSRFSFTTRQVRESFIAALGSNEAAAARGHLFKLANQGRLKPQT